MSRLSILAVTITLMLLAVSCMAPPSKLHAVSTHSGVPDGAHRGAGSEPSHDDIRIEADTVQATPQFSFCVTDAVADNSIPLRRSSGLASNRDLSRPHTTDLANIHVLRI